MDVAIGLYANINGMIPQKLIRMGEIKSSTTIKELKQMYVKKQGGDLNEEQLIFCNPYFGNAVLADDLQLKQCGIPPPPMGIIKAVRKLNQEQKATKNTSTDDEKENLKHQ
mmetsp:Transcript_51417/g.46210  ORF Transcript_51417/g.46210 Transcript_51417/m.46210 type:complete len:111 (+) Transcript_51417:1-333(+)